jgi:hypothetical protein
MANDEEVDDFGGLEGSVTRAEDVRTEAGEQPAPPTGPREDRAAETVLPGEDAPATAATATEDPGCRLLLRRWRGRVRGVVFRACFV